MSRKSVLVVGASRGLGAELVRQYLIDGYEVHATVRDVATPGELARLEGDLMLHRLDVRDAGEIADLTGALIGFEVGLVIHNAGISRGFPREEIMEVNSVAPIRTVEALIDSGALRSGAVVAIMTSQMGARDGRTESLGDYGDSKAALNDEFRRRAGEWGRQGVIAVVIHPGWVRTDMGGASAPLSVVESAAGVRDLLANLTVDQHGRFWTWDGREHPW